MGNATNGNKATTCVKTIPTGCVAIANCRQTLCTQAAGGAATYTATCKLCDSGKGAASTSTVAYTTDKNCRKLGSVVTTQCVECWDGYYWNTTMCKLFSKVFVAGFMVFIGMFIN